MNKEIVASVFEKYFHNALPGIVEAACAALDTLPADVVSSQQHLDNCTTVNEKKAVSLTKAAHMMGVCVPTMQKILYSGEIDYKRCGKRYLISTASINDYLRSHN